MSKEYIEREELLKRNMYGNTSPITYRTYAENLIKSVPAADVVEVVRCRDCKHFTTGMAIGMCKRNENKPILPVCYYDFCSYGVREEEGLNDGF